MYASNSMNRPTTTARGPRGAPAAMPTRRPLFQASPSMRTNANANNVLAVTPKPASAAANNVSYSSLLAANKPKQQLSSVRVARPSSKLIRAAPASPMTPEERTPRPSRQQFDLPPPSPNTMSHRRAAMEILASPNPRAAVCVQSGELALLSAKKQAAPSNATRKLGAVLAETQAKTYTKSQKIYNAMRAGEQNVYAPRRQQGHQRNDSNASSVSTSSTMSEEKRARTRAVIVPTKSSDSSRNVKLRQPGGRTESISSDGSLPAFLRGQKPTQDDSSDDDSYSSYSSSSESEDPRDFACDSSETSSSSSDEESVVDNRASYSSSSSSSSSDASSTSTFVREGTATRVARTPLHARQAEMQAQQQQAKAEAFKAALQSTAEPLPQLQSEDVTVSILDDAQLDESFLARDELIERIRLRLVHAYPSLVEGEADFDASASTSSPVLRFSPDELAERAQQLELEIEAERTEDVIRGEVVVESRAPKFVRSPCATPTATSMPDVWQLPIETSTLYKRRSQAATKVFALPQFNQVVPCQACEGKMRAQCRYCCGIPPDECPECDGSGERADGRACRRCDGQGFRSCVGCAGRGYVACDECEGAGEYPAQYECHVTQNVIDLPASLVEDFGAINGNALASPVELIDTAKQQIAAAAQTLSRANATNAADIKSPVAATCIWQSRIVRIVSVRIPDEDEHAVNTVTVRIFAVPADSEMPIEEVTDDDETFEMVALQIQNREQAPDRYEQRERAAAAVAVEEQPVKTPTSRSKGSRPTNVKVAKRDNNDAEEYDSSEEVFNVYLQRSPLPANKVRFAEQVEAIPSPVQPLSFQAQAQYALAPASPLPLLPLSPSVCPRIGAMYDRTAAVERKNTMSIDLAVDNEDTAAVLAFLDQQQQQQPVASPVPHTTARKQTPLRKASAAHKYV